jgi:hypothetical protein
MEISNLDKIQSEYRELIRDYCVLLHKHFQERLKSICVFGSVATGKATPESDVDVLVVADGMLPDVLERMEDTVHTLLELKRMPSYRRLVELKRCATISPIFLTPVEADRHPPIMLDLVDEGVLLYDENGFLANLLDSIKHRLGELGAKKVDTAKGHYWILKPGLRPGEVVEI